MNDIDIEKLSNIIVIVGSIYAVVIGVFPEINDFIRRFVRNVFRIVFAIIIKVFSYIRYYIRYFYGYKIKKNSNTERHIKCHIKNVIIIQISNDKIKYKCFNCEKNFIHDKKGVYKKNKR
jgi:hypothetical membrane protein